MCYVAYCKTGKPSGKNITSKELFNSTTQYHKWKRKDCRLYPVRDVYGREGGLDQLYQTLGRCLLQMKLGGQNLIKQDYRVSPMIPRRYSSFQCTQSVAQPELPK